MSVGFVCVARILGEWDLRSHHSHVVFLFVTFLSSVMMLPVEEEEEDDASYMSEDSERSSPPTSQGDLAPTGDDIQAAIEKGDWAAVGATAAMLASSKRNKSNHRSDYERPSGSDDSRASVEDASSVDAARATEIDRLVESGNWDGVVAVAARYADDASVQSSRTNRSGSSHHNSVRTKSTPSTGGFESRNEDSSVASASVETADASATTFSGSATTESRSSKSRTSYSEEASYSGTETIDGTDGDTMSDSHYNTRASSSVASSFTSSLVSSSYVSQEGLSSGMASSVSTTTEEKTQMNAYRAEVEALVRRVVPGEEWDCVEFSFVFAAK